MGLEMVKSSTPSYCRKILWESIDIVLNKTQAEMLEFIDYHRSEFMKQQIADIAFPRGVNGLKKFSDKTTIYGKGCPIHVRGSLIYNNFVRTKKLDKVLPTINEGETIKFIFLKEPNHVQSNVIAFPQSLPKEFALEKYIDYNMQFDKSFVEPLKIILDSIGWKTEHVSSLEDFFS
jgi:hypothetical protein